ncbi:MAG: stage 0 sporulation family protein, partial [Phycisphaerae bacterium]
MVMVLEVIPNDDDKGGGCGDGEYQCGNGLERIYPATAVRYGEMGLIGEFKYKENMKFGCGAKVVIQTKRGLEVGEQVSLTCSGCSASVPREKIVEFVGRGGADYYQLESGRIIREATPEDLTEFARIKAGAREKRRICQEFARKHNLAMKVVTCEPLFGGERIIFYFMAEGRVDFRTLVRDLAQEFQTRIEMRQVGARDEARLVADYETCGRECCCKNFLKDLKPVSMKMAKLQKATLDPSKVSGRCGRLKCCLRYEHVSYEELDRLLPRMGKRVRTRHGEGTVVGRQILTQLFNMRNAEGGLVTVAVEDVLGDDEPMPVAKPAAQKVDAPGARPGRRRPGRSGDAKGQRSEPKSPGAASGDKSRTEAGPP